MMYKVYCDNYLIYDTRLTELTIINPSLNLELNKTGSFTFTIYPSHPYYDKLQKLKSIIKVYQDDYIVFRGRILNDVQGWHNEKKVTCEGELAFLVDSIQRPYDFLSGDKSTTISELFSYFITNHNSQVDADHQFIVGNITVTDPNDYIVRADSNYTNTWDSINNKLIDSFGGYLWVRHEEDGNYIDYLADFNTLSSQTIEFGKNLIDLDKTVKGEDIATAIIPLGVKSEDTEERLTIKSVNDDVDYVYNQEAVNKYGWIFKTVVWDDVTVASNLLTKGNKYLADSINLAVSIELSAVDLSAIETNAGSFKLGSYLKVKTKPHDIVDKLFLINKLSLNLTSPKSNKITLGTSYSTFTEKASSSTKGVGDMITQEVVNATSQIGSAIEEVRQQTSSMITQSSQEILSQVSEDYYLKDDANTLIQSISTQFSQTNEAFEMKFNTFNQNLHDVQTNTDAQFQNISKYIRFVDGNIILGEENNPLTLRIENDKISFLENGYEIAYWQNRKFYAVDGEFISSLKLGKYAFIPRDNGNLSFKKVTE